MIKKKARKKHRIPSALPVIEKHLERTLRIKWENVLDDPRVKKYQTDWNFGYMMQILFFGLISGNKSMRAIETFSEKYDERIPDTTLHDTAIKVDAEPIRNLIVKGVKQALRSHELPSEDFPVRLTAIDGKCVAVSSIDVGEFSQKSECNGRTQYNNRVLRAFHVSNPTKLFLGQREIHGKGSETQELRPFLDSLEEDFGNTGLLEVFSLDAGMTSRENADYIKNKGHDYIMALKGGQIVLYGNAIRLLGSRDNPDRVTEEIANGKKVVRKFYRCKVQDVDKHGWSHLEEFWLTDQETTELRTGEIEYEQRYFLSSIKSNKLTDSQAMQAIRMHWGIENNGNWIFDVAFKEDDAPITNRALILISLMRILAYNIISRLINRRLRKAKARQISWAGLMELIEITIIKLKYSIELKEFNSSAFV